MIAEASREMKSSNRFMFEVLHLSGYKMGMKKNSATKKYKQSKKKSPAKKSRTRPVHFTQEKLDLVRQTIISHLWSKEEVAADKIQANIEKEIGEKFSGDFNAHFNKSMEGLLKHKLIEDVPGKKPGMIRLTQRIDV